MTLPSCKKPPVNEVVCGMRFHIPDRFNITHIGLIWNKFRANYPKIQHAVPLASTKGDIIIDAATGISLPRVWFINETDDQLIQFQIDRFYFNWRQKKGDYPRYDHIIKNYESTRDTIENSFCELELGELKPIECELSYINHIPKGQGWDTVDDLPSIFSDFVWKQTSERFLPNPEKIAWSTEFPLPEKKGTLTVNLKQGMLTEGKVPVFVFELKARGMVESESKEVIREWFDLAHEWIVQGFTDLTTSEIQEIWERE